MKITKKQKVEIVKEAFIATGKAHLVDEVNAKSYSRLMDWLVDSCERNIKRTNPVTRVECSSLDFYRVAQSAKKVRQFINQ